MRFYASLYLLIAGVYLLTASGRIGMSDSVAMFNVTQSIVSESSLSSEPCDPQLPGHPNHCVLGRDGKYYSGFGLAPSLVAVPAVVGAKLFTGLLDIGQLAVTRTSVSLFTALIAPLTCVLLAMWIIKLGYSRGTAMVGACILALASPYWHFAAKGFYSEPYFTLALLLAAYLLSCPETPYAAALSGIAFGVACGSRINGVILLPVFVLCLGLYIRDRRLSLAQFIRNTALFSASSGVCGLLIGWANYARFGSPWSTGYQLAFPSTSALLSAPASPGAVGLLFSGEVGLLMFAPWVLVAFACFPTFIRTHLADAVLCGLIFLANFVFFSRSYIWHGGWVAGPRYLVPTLPFLVMALAPHIERLRPGAAPGQLHHGGRRLLVGTLVSVGLLVQVVGTFYPEQRYYNLMAFYKDRPVKPWWTGSISLAALDFMYHSTVSRDPSVRPAKPVISDPVRIAREDQQAFKSNLTAANEEVFIRSLPNSGNLTLPDLILVKMRWLGLPAAAGYAYFGFTVVVILVGLIGIKRSIALNSPTTVPQDAPAG